MQCPSCGFENPEGMKFCGECGNALKNVCQQCGFENPPGFKFCGECGTSLTAQPPSPPLDVTPPIVQGDAPSAETPPTPNVANSR